MATQLRLRRGNTVQTNAFTGASAEVTVDTDKNVIVVHDGYTPGGHPAATLEYVEAAYAQANAAYFAANSDVTQLFTEINVVFVQANSAFYEANAAYDQANSAALYANSAFVNSNAAYDQANSAADYANGAFFEANAAFAAANTKLETYGGTITGSLQIDTDLVVRGKALIGNGVFTILPNTVTQFTGSSPDYIQVNMQNLDGSGSSDFVTTADNGTDSTYYTDLGKQGSTRQDGDILYPNDSYLITKGDDDTLPGSNLVIAQITSNVGDIVFAQGGLGIDNEIARFVYGQGLHIKSGIESTDQFTGSLVIQGGASVQGNVNAYDVYINGVNVSSSIASANSSLQSYVDGKVTLLNGVNTTQNTRITATSTQANSAYDKANSANVLAQAVYDFANTRFSANGGTISGDTTVTGNLTVTGTTFYANTQNLFVEDNVITLNSNVTGTPTLNAGIEVNRGNQTNTSVLWNESKKSWQFTNDGTNYSNIASASAETYANGAFTQANAAFVTANAAVPKAGGTMTGDLLMTANVIPTVSNTYYLGSVDKVWHSLYVGPGSINIDGVVLGNTGGSLSITNSNGSSLDLTQISNTANSAGAYANAAFNYANSAYAKANSAGLYANGAFTQSNASYGQANSAALYANAAFNYANASYDQANSSANYANSAFNYANSSYDQANSAALYANSAFVNSNASYDQANSAALYANGAFIQANAAFIRANTTTNNAAGASLYANGAFIQANAAYDSQNTTGTYANSAFLKANAAYESQNTTGVYANSAFLKANAAYESQNTTGTYANSAFLKANSAYESQNTTGIYANSAFKQANAAYESQNTTGTYANSAYTQANTATNNAAGASQYANAAFLKANSAYESQNTTGIYANAAFLEANSANTLANSKAAVYTQDTAPTDVNVDDIWIDSSSGIEYVNVRSNNATQWVEFGATGTPLNGTAGLGFSDQTMYGVDAGTDVKIQQIGTGNIILQSANTIVTGNLIANAPGKKAEFNNIAAVYFRVNTATTIANSAAINIVASTGYYVQPPTSDGYVLQATGKDNVPSRMVIDSAGTSSYAAFIGRHARGTHQNPTAAQNGDLLARFSGNGYGVSGYGVNAGGASMDIYAIENYTDTSRGASVVLSATPLGTNTRTTIATFTSNTVTMTGQVFAQKGFSSTPRTVVDQTPIVIDFNNDSVIRAEINAATTFSFTNYYTGKQVDVWVTNTTGSAKTVTHGCTSTNSTNNSATQSIPGTSSILMRYICFDGDSANVLVAIIQG